MKSYQADCGFKTEKKSKIWFPSSLDINIEKKKWKRKVSVCERERNRERERETKQQREKTAILKIIIKMATLQNWNNFGFSFDSGSRFKFVVPVSVLVPGSFLLGFWFQFLNHF